MKEICSLQILYLKKGGGVYVTSSIEAETLPERVDFAS
jgi:hypothetical protein